MTSFRPYPFAVAGIALGLLGALLWYLMPLDLGLYGALRLGDETGLIRFATLCSFIGGATGMVPLALAAAIILLLLRRFREAVWLAVTVMSGRLIVEGLKLAFHRPRPPLPDRHAAVDSFSFPSSHSAGTMLTCLALAAVAGGRRPGLLTALLAALVIGWSRLALGVHYPSDVVAGWGFGLFWIAMAIRWLPAQR